MLSLDYSSRRDWFVCEGTPIIREWQKANKIEKILHSKLIFFHEYRLHFFHQGRNWWRTYSMENWVGDYQPNFCIGNMKFRNDRKVFQIDSPNLKWISGFWKSFFSKTTDLASSFQVSIEFFLRSNFPSQIFDLLPCSGILMEQKCQKVTFVQTCFDIQTHNYSAYLLNFSSKVSIDSFFLDAHNSSLNFRKFVLYIRIRILSGQNGQKFYQ